MDWILLGIVAGSLLTGTFKDKEACLGRVATLHEQKIEAKCVEAPKSFATSSIFTITPGTNNLINCCQYGACGPC